MNDPRTYLLLEYEDLQDGVSLSGQLCPFCEGGSTGERTLSVSRKDEQLFWFCHRASCGAKGASHATYSRGRCSERAEMPASRSPPEQDGPKVDPLSPEAARYLQEGAGISVRAAARAGLGEVVEHSGLYVGRIYCPLRGPEHQTRGATYRRYGPHVLGPKNLHRLNGHPALGWYRNWSSDKLLLVEDVFSAIRASAYLNAACLLSTHLSEDKVMEIRKAGFREAYLALDKDAFPVAVEHATKWRSLLLVKVVPLQKDIKNMTEEELQEWLSNHLTL